MDKIHRRQDHLMTVHYYLTSQSTINKSKMEKLLSQVVNQPKVPTRKKELHTDEVHRTALFIASPFHDSLQYQTLLIL